MKRYDIYLYVPISGQLQRIIENVDEVLAKPMAADYHVMDHVDVKVVDREDGCIILSLTV